MFDVLGWLTIAMFCGGTVAFYGWIFDEIQTWSNPPTKFRRIR